MTFTAGAMISQFGLVPSGTKSMFFSMAGAATQFASTFSVSVDGQSLPYYAKSTALNSYGDSYTIYAADVSAFSGQDVTLDFSSTRRQVIAPPIWALDDIGFSPLPVPEPGEFALISFGTIMFGFHCCRKLKSLA